MGLQDHSRCVAFSSRQVLVAALVLGLYSVSVKSNDENTVVGVGSSLVQLFNERALLTYSLITQPTAALEYQSLNSEAGSCRIKDYYTYCNWDRTVVPYADFASSEIPLTDEDTERWPDLLQMPAVAAAVVPVYNLENYDPFAPNLVLDRDTMVGIFSGNITRWDDPRIVNLQSESVGSRLPQAEIQVIGREDVSGSTYVMKKFLSRSSVEFDEQTGVSSSSDWPGVEGMLRFPGNAGVATGVRMHVNSIGYCDLATAKRIDVQVADIKQESGVTVQAGVSSIEYAMFERGVELDANNQADLTNARGDNAWPVTTYSYAILRTNSLGDRMRVGATCETTYATTSFFDWFYSSDLMETILDEFFMVSLAKNTRLDVVDDLNSKVWCEGELVKHSLHSSVTTGELLIGDGLQTADGIMDLVFEKFQLQHINTDIAFSPNRTNVVAEPLLETEAFRVIAGNQIFEEEWYVNNTFSELHDTINNTDTFLAMPWYLMPLRVIYRLPSYPYSTATEDLVVSRELLIGILTGEVTTWDNSLMVHWNPWLAGVFFQDPIILIELDDPQDMVVRMTAEMLGIDLDLLTWNDPKHRFSSYAQIAEVVQLTPGAIGVVPYVTSGLSQRYASLNFHGTPSDAPVTLTLDSIGKCVGPQSYNPTTFQFTPQLTGNSGKPSGCYPLVLPVYVLMRYSYENQSLCLDEFSRGVQTTEFLRFLFLDGGAETEEPIAAELAMPLTWQPGNERHLQRIHDVMHYMPCGFERPVEPPPAKDILIMAAIFAGGIFLIILCCCISAIWYYQRRKRLFMNPLYGVDVQKTLEMIYEDLISIEDGNVATYIPQLGNVDPNLFGIALMKTDGHIYHIGDATHPFTIQSICKPFLYAFGIQFNGEEFMQSKIGVEPSGAAFNSEKLNDDGLPFNPFINAGAIACCANIALGDADSRFEFISKFMGSLTVSGSLLMDAAVYYSEVETADQNRLIGKVLHEATIIETEYDMEHGLESYFMACSTEVTCVDLACMAACLANNGVHPMSRLDVLGEDIANSVTSVMMTCGMYNGAGNWMVNVGIPAKSGVSGGILAVVPGVCGISVFSPRLDAHGNSVRGMEVCSALSQLLGLHTLLGGKGKSGKDRSRGGGSVRGGDASRRSADHSNRSSMAGK